MGFAPALIAAAPGQTTVFTAPPPGGFPQIHGLDGERLREGVADRQLTKWDNPVVVEDKLFVFPWNPTRHSTGSTTIEALKGAIHRITGAIPLIGPAEAAPNARHGLPFIYLVKRLSAADVARLIDGVCWNLSGFTFFAIDCNPGPSPWLITLDGLLFTEDEGVDVANLVADVICTRADTTTFLSLTHDNYPADADPISHFRASIRVFPITLQNPGGGSSRIAWNIYANAPSQVSSANRAWITLLNGVDFDSDMHYVGRAISPPLLCNNCRSYGHISDLCTFPHTPNWHKPTTTTTAPQSTTSSTRGRGGNPSTGVRGRGNGRGSSRGSSRN
ncbi:hypothetical protein C8R46DRAFT_1060198 [Mycena filopes]|nr:hypothetical protein C8R46DRAFT_1060198 [Mycena filopes]